MTQSPLKIDALLTMLKSHPDLPVIFTQNEQSISPGYHVTEVKMSVVNSLDCGQGTDQWRELAVQLLDGNAHSSQAHMPATKMIGILDKALAANQADDNTQLYFEFAIGNAALQKSSVKAIEVVNNTVTIALSATTAQCKPFERALASSGAPVISSGCCGSAPTPAKGCCDTGSTHTGSSCCG